MATYSYPLVDDATHLVVNSIVYEDGVSETWTPPPGQTLIKQDGVPIGWLWLPDEETFVGPDDERHPDHQPAEES